MHACTQTNPKVLPLPPSLPRILRLVIRRIAVQTPVDATIDPRPEIRFFRAAPLLIDKSSVLDIDGHQL
jgi:hypothetical protein